MKTVDTTISAKWIIPVAPKGRVYEGCTLVILQGQIVDIVPDEQAKALYRSKETINLPNHALLPGLINAHGHTPMSLLRGFADDFPLMTWLNEHIWPAEQKWVNEEFVHDGSELAIAEMLLSGTTCFSDMYFFPEVTAKLALKHGIRAQINFPILDFPTAWGGGPDEYFRKGLDLWDQYRTQELINIGFGPHSPYTVTDDSLGKIATYSEELQAPIHIHLHETAAEVEDAIEEHGKRPIQRLKDLGLMSPLMQCVHMTQINDEDRAILSDTGAHVVHCPDSNLKLASGICPVQDLLDQSINVALGTDGAASNNDLNLLSEMQTAALIGKYKQNNASAINAQTALEIATINGAKAMGLAETIGSLEKGKSADCIAVDLSDLAYQPVHNPVSQLVYTHAGNQVSDVWIRGQRRVENHKLVSINTEKLIKTAYDWRNKISRQH